MYCVVKCLPVISLITFVCLCGVNLGDSCRYARWILYGLFTSLLGNIFMVWNKLNFFLYTGTVCFTVANIMYIRAFGLRPYRIQTMCGFIAVHIVIFFCIREYIKGMFIVLIPVHSVIICGMVWRSTIRVNEYDDTWRWARLCGCAGTGCFLISDFVFTFDRFLYQAQEKTLIVMVFYFAAQFGITLSVVGSQADERVRIKREASKPHSRLSTTISQTKAGRAYRKFFNPGKPLTQT